MDDAYRHSLRPPLLPHLPLFILYSLFSVLFSLFVFPPSSVRIMAYDGRHVHLTVDLKFPLFFSPPFITVHSLVNTPIYQWLYFFLRLDCHQGDNQRLLANSRDYKIIMKVVEKSLISSRYTCYAPMLVSGILTRKKTRKDLTRVVMKYYRKMLKIPASIDSLTICMFMGQLQSSSV